MSKVKTLLLLLIALALLVAIPQSAQCGEQSNQPDVASTATPTDNSTVIENYNIEYEKPPAKDTVLTPEKFQEYQKGNIPTLGTRGVRIKKTNYAGMSDNELSEALAIKLWELAEMSENMKARSAVGEFEVPIGTLERIESLAGRIKEASSTTMTNKVDRNLKHSVELVALKAQVANAELTSGETRNRVNGLHQEMYGTFTPLTIRVKFNPVQQKVEKAVYLNGNDLDFVAVVVPGRFGGSIVSLQKDIKSGLYAPMSCNNIAGYPLDADGYRMLTLTVGAERYASPEEALKGLCDTYRVDPDRALALIRNGV